MIPAVENILALVCGYSEAKRAERRLCMMQAYIDDSTESRAVLVLAGYIASDPQWLAFAEKWQNALHEERLKVFKMNKLKQPHHYPRVERFYRIIESTVSGGFYIAVPISALSTVCAEFNIAPRYRSPYYMAWILLISVFRKLYTETKWNPPLDLIFDNQKEEKFILKAWHILKDKQKGDIAPLKNTPAFRSDEDVLPLQAADLLAWWVRKDWLKHGTIKNAEWLFPWEDKSGGFPYLLSEMNENEIRQHFKNNLVLPGDLGHAEV